MTSSFPRPNLSAGRYICLYVYMFICLYVYMFIYLEEGRCQLSVWWLYAMLVILKDMIIVRQNCLSNAALHMKQDTLHQYRDIEI